MCFVSFCLCCCYLLDKLKGDREGDFEMPPSICYILEGKNVFVIKRKLYYARCILKSFETAIEDFSL